MHKMKYVLLQLDDQLEFVEIPAEYAYQLSALNLRLHKETGKLTAPDVPRLPRVIAECGEVDILEPSAARTDSLTYIQRLEAQFASIRETSYPLVSLLTEIRALLAQLEQWYEEEGGR